MKSQLVAIIAAVLLVGCATSQSLNLSFISVGMDKQKVIALKGEPFRVAAIDGLDTLFTEDLTSIAFLMVMEPLKPLFDSKMVK